MTAQSHDLVPVRLAVRAMRDSGYRNTAYAAAELIDNAVQAGARHVELLCCEREHVVRERRRRNIHQIGVLDDGCGMNKQVLRRALQFGNGEHLDDRSGIGRFGMGLPSSSISQCRKVDVWSWQGSPDAAIHSYIDLGAVEEGTMVEVPEPRPTPIPDVWRAAGRSFGTSGTLVVWSELDRCMWKTGATILKNSDLLVGRMYRRFLHEGRVRIRLAVFVESEPGCPIEDREAEVNDPLYLMVPSSTPAPYDHEPMFQPDGDEWEVQTRIEVDGAEHTVTTRFTIARDEVRSRPNAGSTPYGRHAAKNVGVSLMRADRELELETSLVNTYDPRERWWGVEVDFPPSLDELFGVTNNKQAARHFSDVATTYEELANDARSLAELRETMKASEDPRLPLIELIALIDRRLKRTRELIRVQAQGQRGARKRFGDSSPEVRATNVARRREQEGHRGASDDDERQLPPDERKELVSAELVEGGLAPGQAREIAARLVDQGLKFTFQTAVLEGRAFFSVRAVGGELIVRVNSRHPAYKNLVEVLEDDPTPEEDSESLRARVQRARDGLKLLLMAWARYEDEQSGTADGERIQDIRTDWGRIAWEFLA